MAINYPKLQSDITALLNDLGEGLQGTVAHAAGTTSKGNLVISSINITVTDQSHVSRVVGQQLVGFIEDIKTPPCPGDTLTAQNVTYKIKDVSSYNPSGKVNIAYKLLLDA